MQHIFDHMECCAVGEYHGLNFEDFTPEAALKVVCQGGGYDMPGGWLDGCSFSHVMFTEVRDRKSFNIEKMRDIIAKHGLGTFTTSRGRNNPNSGNTVKVAMWSVDPQALWRYYRNKYGANVEAHEQVGIGPTFWSI